MVCGLNPVEPVQPDLGGVDVVLERQGEVSVAAVVELVLVPELVPEPELRLVACSGCRPGLGAI